MIPAVEVGALFGEGQVRAAAFGLELDGGERDGYALAVEVHIVGIDDPLVWNDVLVDAAEARDRATGRAADAGFAAANAEVQLVFVAAPLVGAVEPSLLGLLGREGGKDASRRLPEVALEGEAGVGDAT